MASISPERERELIDLVGDPAMVATELTKFREAAKALSSDQPRFIEAYPQQWVAVWDTGQVLASESLDELLREVDDRGIQREHAIVRFIDRSERTLFL